MRLGVAAALVDGEVVPGDVVVVGDRLVGVGEEPAGARGLAAPGFVDLQVNGFAGVDLLAADLDGHRTVARALAATGVTAYQPTFVSQPPSVVEAAAATTTAAMDEDAWTGARILGLHLEGPFLDPDHAGAHDPAHLLAPDLAMADRLCGSGPATTMTVAPELEGGLDLVAHLAARGVVVSLGHSGADAATAHRAVDLGARTVTHLHNAMRRWAPRDPGLAGVALARPDVVVQAIVDGVHLAPETVVTTMAAAAGRVAAVTDAIAAAGMPPGTSRLGDREVHVDGHSARLADGTLAGSIGTLDAAVRILVSLGVDRRVALASVTSVPAGLLRRPELGTLRPGTPADVVVLDDDLRVVRTLVAGREVFAR